MRFGVTADAFPYAVGDTVDLAVTMDVQTYRGETSLSLVAREIRAAGMSEESLLSEWRLYEKFRRREALSEAEFAALLPNRALFEKLYRFLKSVAGWDGDAITLWRRSGTEGFAKFLVALDTLAERELISLHTDTVVYRIALLPVSGKKDLLASAILQQLHRLRKG